MRDILFPLTDGGVLAQLIGVTLATVVAAVLVRRHREIRAFVTGVGVFLVALMAVRALH
ncbi:MAG: hypothetical protein AB7W59_08305 [Acidimicrobiia bacterium]